jgi:hypothetical protein
MNPFDEQNTEDAAGQVIPPYGTPPNMDDYYDYPVDGPTGDTGSVKEKKPEKGKIRSRIVKKKTKNKTKNK